MLVKPQPSLQAAHDMTIDYMKTRQQFGRPIGSFQALQHRAADMLVALEQSRSMSYFAAMSAAERNPGSGGRRWRR